MPACTWPYRIIACAQQYAAKVCLGLTPGLNILLLGFFGWATKPIYLKVSAGLPTDFFETIFANRKSGNIGFIRNVISAETDTVVYRLDRSSLEETLVH